MSPQETILYHIELPDILTKFKDTLVEQLLAPIDRAIQALESASDPVLFLLLVILFIQMVRLAIVQATISRKEKANSDVSDWHSAGKEIKDLKKELKALQKSVEQLKKGGTSVGRESRVKNSRAGAQVSRMIQSCKESWRRRQQIAEHILDYQIKLIDEVKKIKKNSKAIPTHQSATNAKPVAQPVTSNINAQRINEVIYQEVPKKYIRDCGSTETELQVTKTQPAIQQGMNDTCQESPESNNKPKIPLSTSVQNQLSNIAITTEINQQEPSPSLQNMEQRQEKVQPFREQLLKDEMAAAQTPITQVPESSRPQSRQLLPKPVRPVGKGQKRAPPLPPRRF